MFFPFQFPAWLLASPSTLRSPYCRSLAGVIHTLAYQSLPTSIPCGEAIARRRKEDRRVGLASRGPSAESNDLFWHDQMRFPLTTIVGIDTRCECVCTQQPVRFRHGTFPMDPLRFDGVEPWACAGQRADHEAHTDRAPLDLLMVLAEPVPYGVAPVP